MREFKFNKNEKEDIEGLMQNIIEKYCCVNFYKRKIKGEDKTTFIYVVEINRVDWEVKPSINILSWEINMSAVEINTIVTITLIATVREDKTVIRLITPSDDNTLTTCNYSIIPSLKINGFKLERVK